MNIASIYISLKYKYSYRHNFQFALVGLPCGHAGTPTRNHAHTVSGVHVHPAVVCHHELLAVCGVSLFQWIFVSSAPSGDGYLERNLICIYSVSGSSATIYAYLGEFHTLKYRSRAIMGASVIFGITCVTLPVLAWLVINQTWQLYIPLLDLVFKPWRLFLLVCGLPSLICGLALLWAPESPKFVLSQGRQADTIAILQTVHRANVGAKVEPLVIPSIIEELESIARRERNEQDHSGAAMRILKAMWSQTTPLFQSPNLKRTMIACSMQFGIYITSNGMYMWFPEILNRVADYTETHPDREIALCDILSATKTNVTGLVIGEVSGVGFREMHCFF